MLAPCLKVLPLCLVAAHCSTCLALRIAGGEGLQLEVGLRADNRHANGRGTVHGGVLATLADIGMGYAMAFSSEPPLPLITASMTVDYLGAVQVGEWITVRLEHHKRGRQMAFGTVSLQVGEKVVARANAVFAVPQSDTQ